LGLHPFKIKNELFKLQFSFNLHNQDAAYGTTTLLAQQMGLFNQLIHDRKLNNKHRLLSGLTLRYTHYQDDAPVRLGNSFVQQFVIPGAFVQEEFTPNNRQTILLGARVDYYNFHGFIFSPRANYKWQINSNNAIRLSAGNGFRIVNIFTEDHAALTGARELVIAENLKPEKTWNMNVNYSNWRNQKQGFLEWDVSAFYTWFGNKIIPDYDQDPNKIVYQNLSGFAVSRGITLNTAASFVFPLKINAGFTLMDVFAQQTDSLGNNFRQVQMHAPRFSGTFQISYAWKPIGLTLDYTGQVYGPMRLPILPNDFRPEYSPWFSLQNVQLTKRFGPKFECYTSIKNLWNFLPAHPLIRWWDPFDKRVDKVIGNPQGYQFDAGYNFAPMQGRTLLFGLRYLLP
jgi:outer membrane receptor for ferrienterochelin and colicins